MAKLKSLSSKHMLEFTIENALEDFQANSLKPLYTKFNDELDCVDVYMFPQGKRRRINPDSDEAETFLVARVSVTMLTGMDAK